MSNKNDNPIFQALQKQTSGKPIEWNESDIKKNPAGYALMSKLVRNANQDNFTHEGKLSDTTPSLDYLLSIASDKAQDVDDNEAIMQLLPDISRAAQLLVSYVLSPTFISPNPELHYIPPSGVFPQTVGASIVESVKRYLNKGYGLDGRLYDILYKILFTKGAYITAVIPESSLDEFINPELTQENFTLGRDKLSAINKELERTERACYGYSGKSTEKRITFSKENYAHTINGLEITHGSDNETPRETVHYSTRDTRITLSTENITHELPKEFQISKKENNNTVLTNILNFNVKGKDSYVEYTDDLGILKLGWMKRKIIDDESLKKMGLSTEASTGVFGSDRELLNKLFKNIDNYQARLKSSEQHQLKVLKNNKQTYRQDLGEPLIIEYPVESIIPVYKPGSPTEHIGYLALHDEDGSPLSKVKPINYYRDLSNSFNYKSSSNSMASSLIQQGRQMFDGFSNVIDEARQIEMLAHIHGNAIIKEILDRTREGEYGKNLDLGDSSDVYRIMFYRAIRGQRTRVIFLPKDIVTYFAHDFDNKGIGRSLIDNMKVLLSLKIQFMLARIRAGIANSIPETLATIRIDEKDPDPKKTIQIAQALLLKSRHTAGMMIGTSNVQTIEERIQQSNIRIAIESEHPKVPNIGHDISRSTADIPTPDNETAEDLDRLSRMGTLLPPELIDNSYGVDFAKQILQQNFMVDMVGALIQNSVNPSFTDFAKKVILASPTLRKEIRDIIQANIKDIMDVINEASGDEIKIDALSKESIHIIIDRLVDKFIADLVVRLPEKINDNDELLNEQISKTEERVEKVLGYLFSQEALPASMTGEEAAQYVEEYKGILKSEIMVQKLSEMGYGTEILEKFHTAEDGTQTYEYNKTTRDNKIILVKAMVEMLKESANIAKSTSSVVTANDIVPEGAGDSYSSSDSDSSDSGGGDEWGGDEWGDEGDDGEGGEGDDGDMWGSDDADGAPD